MLTFVYGCMGAGKTTDILKKYRVIAKPVIDDREGVQIGWGTTTPRNSNKSLHAFYFKNINDALNAIEGTFVVDEGQFLSESEALLLLKEADKREVIVYGLKTDAFGKVFPTSAIFLALADEIVEITSKCEVCGVNKAVAHLRFSHGKPVFAGDVFSVEKGDITYKRVCRHCFIELSNPREEEF